MVNWNLNLLRIFGKWLTWVLHSEHQARIGARLEQGISGVYHERQRRHQDVSILRALNNVLQGEGRFTRRQLEEIAVSVKSDLRYVDEKPWWSQLFSTTQKDEQKGHRRGGTMPGRQLEIMAVPENLADLEDAKPWWSRLFSMIMQKRQRSFFRDYSTNLVKPALATRNKDVLLFDDLETIAELPHIDSYGDELVGILLSSLDPVSNAQHWVAMRMVEDKWYYLDSLLLGPRSLNGEVDLKQEMTSAVSNSGSVAFVRSR